MMLATYRRLVGVSFRALGFSRSLLGWLVLAPIYFLFTRATLALDHLFFPEVRRVRVRQPVFIIGHPRSGTTLLHRLLTEGGDFCSFRTWELVFPALTARWLVNPLLKRLRRRRKTLVPASVGHEISLDGVEEEEFLFLHSLDTQFLLTRTPLVFDDFEHPELRLHDTQPATRRHASVRFFETCLKRQILATGRKRVAAQLHFSVHRVRTLIEAFPDAKFIYLQRSPLETIPSHLSLVKSSLAFQWGEERFPAEVLQSIFARRYQASIDLYACSHNLFSERILNDENTVVVPYESLSTNLQSSMERVFEFLKHDASTAQWEAILKQGVAQAKYQRPHAVLPLAAFGLTETRIEEDLSFAFRSFRPRNRRVPRPPAIQAIPQATIGAGMSEAIAGKIEGRSGRGTDNGEENRQRRGEQADLPFVAMIS